jgi:hypothetical protein
MSVTITHAPLIPGTKAASIAASGTLTLTPFSLQHVTGSTTITDIDFTGALDGSWAWVVFDAAPLITYNSTSLKLPNGANIQAQAGDYALFAQDSGDNVICLDYVRVGTGSILRAAGDVIAALTAKSVADALAEVALTAAATIACDMSAGINFGVTLGGNRTLGLPTNMTPGKTGRFRFTQDATGSRTLAYASGWKFPSATAPVLTTTAARADYLYYEVLTSSTIWGSLNRDIR